MKLINKQTSHMRKLLTIVMHHVYQPDLYKYFVYSKLKDIKI